MTDIPVIVNNLLTGESGYIPTFEVITVDENMTIKELLDWQFPMDDTLGWGAVLHKGKSLVLQRPLDEYPNEQPPF